MPILNEVKNLLAGLCPPDILDSSFQILRFALRGSGQAQNDIYLPYDSIFYIFFE